MFSLVTVAIFTSGSTSATTSSFLLLPHDASKAHANRGRIYFLICFFRYVVLLFRCFDILLFSCFDEMPVFVIAVDNASLMECLSRCKAYEPGKRKVKTCITTKRPKTLTYSLPSV